MPEEQRTVQDSQGKTFTVVIRRDGRLKKSARWIVEKDGTVLLRIPHRLPEREISQLLKDVVAQIERRENRTARRKSHNDADLKERAEWINNNCFGSQIRWRSIRWVGNMQHRLGSCTNGGTTDGDIRISDRIKGWPQWVIDYIIAHELAHRVVTNHSTEFWDLLTGAYPMTEQARGFIKGVAFAQGETFEDD
ncbi:MAG: M48 family metallopeptidase [Anaerolineae bacterium]|nr:M48 family metallopeptidase [Anaerolineae bacterium]